MSLIETREEIVLINYSARLILYWWYHPYRGTSITMSAIIALLVCYWIIHFLHTWLMSFSCDVCDRIFVYIFYMNFDRIFVLSFKSSQCNLFNFLLLYHDMYLRPYLIMSRRESENETELMNVSCIQSSRSYYLYLLFRIILVF